MSRSLHIVRSLLLVRLFTVNCSCADRLTLGMKLNSPVRGLNSEYEAYYYSLASQQVCKSVEHNAHYHRTAFLIDPAAVHIKLTAPINETISGRKLWAVQL